MAHSISAAPLLFLSLLVSTCYGVDPLCVTNYSPSINATSNSNFNLNVSSDILLANTTYSVSVNGTGNSFNVTLQAVSSSIPVGNWSMCMQSLQFTNVNLTNSSIQTDWTSPANLTGVTDVTINAYIANDTQTYLISKVLSPAVNTSATSAPATQTAVNTSATSAPANQTAFVSTSNSTGNSTNAPSNHSTAPTSMIKQTTSGGSSYHSNLISTAGIQILFLFMISKYLS